MNPFNFSQHDFLVISGPCAVEDEKQMRDFLNTKTKPAHIRGGIYKMRSNKNSFQGLGASGIDLIRNLKKDRDFHFFTEVTDPRQIDHLLPIVSGFQIGARNMYNYELLKELALYKTPVILKRAFSATISEWLGAAEYLSQLGDDNIILCERGVRSFDNKLRNLLDLGSVIYLKKNTPFKVIVDPSHAMGYSQYVADASYAALAAGADGVIIESHPRPQEALSDAQQAIALDTLELTLNKLQMLCPYFNKQLKV